MTKITYIVETVDGAHINHVPWWDANRAEGLNERKAVARHNQADRRYHPEGGGWSGHVRIVGSDGWTHTVEPPSPGGRSTLQRLYHLDDLA